MLIKMKLGSFKVVISTVGTVFISLDCAPRISLASDEEGCSMLALNGNIKPLPKAPEGVAPSSPTLKVGDLLFVHNAHS